MRRNLKTVPELPCGAHLLAIAYGTGKDDYLAIVLGYIPDEEKYVTWIWNSAERCEGFAEGHYIGGGPQSVAWSRVDDTPAEQRAWQDFSDRAKDFTMKAAAEYERAMTAALEEILS